MRALGSLGSLACLTVELPSELSSLTPLSGLTGLCHLRVLGAAGGEPPVRFEPPHPMPALHTLALGCPAFEKWAQLPGLHQLSVHSIPHGVTWHGRESGGTNALGNALHSCCRPGG